MPNRAWAKASANICKVTLEVPWEVAEIIVQYGPELLEALGAQVTARRQFEADREKARQAVELDTRERWKRFRAIGRQATRELRQVDSSSNPDPALVRTLASRYGLSADALLILVNRHRQRLRERWLRKRDREIIRLYLSGLSNRQIADELANRGRPLSPGRIGQIIKRERRQIAAERRARLQTVKSAGGKEPGRD